MMTRQAIPVVAATIALAMGPIGPVHAAETEWSGSAVYRFLGLGDFDGYEDAIGAEIQYRSWLGDRYGLALSIGCEEWSGTKGDSDWGQLTGGSVTVWPVGAGLIARPMVFDTGQLTLEAGLRYAVLDSDITVQLASGETPVDLDPAWLGHFALAFDGFLSETWALFGGVGYEADIGHARAEADRYKLMDNQMENFFLQVGGRVKF